MTVFLHKNWSLNRKLALSYAIPLSLFFLFWGFISWNTSNNNRVIQRNIDVSKANTIKKIYLSDVLHSIQLFSLFSGISDTTHISIDPELASDLDIHREGNEQNPSITASDIDVIQINAHNTISPANQLIDVHRDALKDLAAFDEVADNIDKLLMEAYEKDKEITYLNMRILLSTQVREVEESIGGWTEDTDDDHDIFDELILKSNQHNIKQATTYLKQLEQLQAHLQKMVQQRELVEKSYMEHLNNHFQFLENLLQRLPNSHENLSWFSIKFSQHVMNVIQIGARKTLFRKEAITDEVYKPQSSPTTLDTELVSLLDGEQQVMERLFSLKHQVLEMVETLDQAAFEMDDLFKSILASHSLDSDLIKQGWALGREDVRVVEAYIGGYLSQQEVSRALEANKKQWQALDLPSRMGASDAARLNAALQQRAILFSELIHLQSNRLNTIQDYHQHAGIIFEKLNHLEHQAAERLAIQSFRKIKNQMSRTKNITLILLLTSTTLAFLFSILIGQSIIQPIKRLIHSTQKISDGDFSTRTNMTSTDEMGLLSNAFDNMADKLQSSISKITQSQNELQLRAEQLEKSDQYKSQFLANMSHELRTPLNSILILSKLMIDDDQLNPETKESASVIFNSSQDLITLISDVLDMSKIEAGKMDVILEEVKPKPFMQKIGNACKPLAHKKGLQFQLIWEDPAESITTDGNRLRQILNNLIANAVKFTASGGVQITVGASSLYEGGVRIEVKDSGIGIPEDQTEQIFQPFRQVDAGTSRLYGGTGLGLPISKSLVDLLGGKIQVDSQLGQGSTFTVDLPAAPPNGRSPFMDGDHQDQPPTTPSNPSPPPLAQGLPQPAPLSLKNDMMVGEDLPINMDQYPNLEGKNVLLVEDDTRNSYAMLALFEKVNLQMTLAGNGLEALELLADPHHDLDLILMDIMMPEMDGHTAIQKIREQSHLAELPILVLSADARAEHQQQCLDLGASDFQSKPVDLPLLFSKMNRLFQGNVEVGIDH